MTERVKGRSYDADRDVVDDAKMIRAEIAAYRKAGIVPADWTYQVRTARFAGGCSIDITATSPRPVYACNPDTIDEPFAYNAELDRWVTAHADRYTIEAQATLIALAELHAAYNHDGSDISTDYFDVKFYGYARLDTVAGVPRWAGSVERHAAPS